MHLSADFWPKGLELLIFTKQITYNLLTQIYSFNTARLKNFIFMPRYRITVEVKWIKFSFHTAGFVIGWYNSAYLLSPGYLIAFNFIQSYEGFHQSVLLIPLLLAGFSNLGLLCSIICEHISMAFELHKIFCVWFQTSFNVPPSLFSLFSISKWGKISSQGREELFQSQCLYKRKRFKTLSA